MNEIKHNQEYTEFIQLLQWKDKQNLIFYMLDDYNTDYDRNKCEFPLIAPFWYHFSEKLTNLHDPVTNKKYSELHLNTDYYHQTGVEIKFGVKVSAILAELYFVSMKFKTMKEIIYQSNKTLNIIQFYGECHNDFIKCEINGDEWYISNDYLSEL